MSAAPPPSPEDAPSRSAEASPLPEDSPASEASPSPGISPSPPSQPLPSQKFSPPPLPEAALPSTGPLSRLRRDLAALSASAARPGEVFRALLVIAVGLAAGGMLLSRLDNAVQRVEGQALTGPDGQPRSVTSLRWDRNDRLELGTVGAGVVTWDAATQVVEADPDPDQGRQTVLSLPTQVSGTVLERAPAVILRSVPPRAADVGEFGQESILFSADLLEAEGRRTTLVYNADGSSMETDLPGTDMSAIVGESVLVIASRDALQRTWTRANRRPAPPDITIPGFGADAKLIASPDNAVAFAGASGGRVVAVNLALPADTTDAPTSFRDLYDFALPGDTGDGPTQSPAVVALATSGIGENEFVAAAASDGRIVLLRAVENAAQPPESLPLRNVNAVVVGLPPPALWVEPVQSVPLSGIADLASVVPLGFDRTRRSLTVHDVQNNQLVQVAVGGGGEALLSLDSVTPSESLRALPDDFAAALSDLPMMQTLSASPPLLTPLRDALPWKLPLDLLLGTVPSGLTEPPTRNSVGFPGSARDPDSGRVVLWGSRGEILLLTPGVEDPGPDLGDGRLVADAAFEPGSGALVVLYQDGSARRWTTGADLVTDLIFAPPLGAEGSPAPTAGALAFPPGEPVTLVQWNRTDKSPITLRRYDRVTAEPLGQGLAVGYEDLILPDRSNLLVSAINGQEVLVRDARTGGTVLHVVFEGGTVQLTPSNDGRDLGIVRRDNAIWTLRVDPPGGGTPPAFPEPLAVALLEDLASLPLPIGVGRDGLVLSADGSALMARGRDGQMYAARLAEAASLGPDVRCCIALRPILPGVVALKAVLSPDGSKALIAGADHVLWQVDLEAGDRAVRLVQLAGPVRAMALSPDGDMLAVAAEGAEPVVVRLARASWLAGLPLVGHAPFAVPAALTLRDAPPAAIPAGAILDTVVVGTFRTPSAAQDLRDSLRAGWPEVRILAAAGFYLVTVPLADTGQVPARQALQRLRASVPSARGASLSSFQLLCPAPAEVSGEPPVDFICIAPPPVPPTLPPTQAAD